MDIYGTAWKNLEHKIAATRRQSISKADLVLWQLEALEQAVDKCGPLSTNPLAIKIGEDVPFEVVPALPETRPGHAAIRRHAGIED